MAFDISLRDNGSNGFDINLADSASSSSISPSVSPSASISPSASASASPSPSASVSPSSSTSVSVSPSSSTSASISPSASVSPSAPPLESLRITAIVVHNRNVQGNADHIAALESKITKFTNTIEIRDDDGNILEVREVSFYRFNSVSTIHHAYFHQIVPYGVTIPTDMYDIESRNVYYGDGDENKTGEHPRFLNYGLRRAAQRGSDVIIYIKDASQITAEDLDEQLENISTELVIVNSATIMIHRSVLPNYGMLNENLSFADAITDLLGRIG